MITLSLLYGIHEDYQSPRLYRTVVLRSCTVPGGLSFPKVVPYLHVFGATAIRTVTTMAVPSCFYRVGLGGTVHVL